MSTWLKAAWAAACWVGAMGSAAASTAEELAEIRAELQSLIQRVDRLEQENVALQAENAALKSRIGRQVDDLRADARVQRMEPTQRSPEPAKAKGADWASKLSLQGDLRYRYEYISDEARDSQGRRRAADRHRDRVRARLSVTARATDDIIVGIGMATAEAGDPRSTNQTLDEVFSRKSLDLDLAYFDWRFAEGAHLIGGKMKQPFKKPSHSAYWDNDINPEGLALTFERGMWFGSAYRYWIDEISGGQGTRTSDVMLHGGQLGVKLPVGSTSLTLAAHYYDLSGGVGRAPFHDGNANGNTTIGAVPVLVYDYRVVSLMAELDWMWGRTPVQFWLDTARNQDPDEHDGAWAAGMVLGKAGSPQRWEAGVAYQKIEKDALFAQLIDSNFGGGSSDSEGWALRAGFAPMRNALLNATYFLNRRNAEGGTPSDYDRLQLDFNVKF